MKIIEIGFCSYIHEIKLITSMLFCIHLLYIILN